MNYPQTMEKKMSSKAGQFEYMLGAALPVSVTGCVGYVDRPRERNVYVEPARVFIEQDDYVYYPGYQMYYGSRSHHYYYQEGSSWVSRPAPRGVSASVLFAAPSVTLDFHDGPAMHHPQVIRTYPKNWKPSAENPGHREEKR